MTSADLKIIKVAKQINISREDIVAFLATKGHTVESKPTVSLTPEQYELVMEKYSKELKHTEKQREKIEKHKATSHKSDATVSLRTKEQERQAEIAAKEKAEREERERILLEKKKKEDKELQARAKAEAERKELERIENEKKLELERIENEKKARIEAELGARAAVRATVEEFQAKAQEIADKIAETERAAEEEAKPKENTAPTPPAEEENNTSTEGEVQDDELVDDESGDGTKKKRKRKNNVVITSQPGQMPQLRGLTVVGKIDIKKQQQDDRDRERNSRLNSNRDRNERDRNRNNDRNRPNDNRSDSSRGNDQRGNDSRDNQRNNDQRQGDRSGKGGQQNQERVRDNRTQGNRPQNDQTKPTEPNTGVKVSKGFTVGGAIDDEDRVRGRGKKPRTDIKGKKPTPGQSASSLSAQKKKPGAKGMRESFSDVDVERKIRETLAGMDYDAAARQRSKIKQRKKDIQTEREMRRIEDIERESTILRVTEFLSTAELANFMGVSPAEIITKCFSLGLMVSINQRLDKETIQLIADDYGYTVEFSSDTEIDIDIDIEDAPESLVQRPPIVTIMGHVDHGKTSLLDYIRNANVVAGEAGGITQHIGAYKVQLPSGKSIAFLDTPGHEAFTAMRARGAQVTDIVILVVAADDNVMPQTLEAISHAQAANVPMVVAINKIDKEEARPDNIRQQLASNGVLVEEWGGKYQCVEVSAKRGLNVDTLLEKIALEAELLELKANPDRFARGTVIEAHVDKGKGNVATVMVQKGTLNIGDAFLCGQFFGRVRAMYDERGNRIASAGPSTPAQITGFDGLPEAGDIMIESDDEALLRDTATKRQILRREQQLRQVRHITLDDISNQISQGGIKELRLILKTDVSGSLEALTDSLLKLSRDEVKVNIIYRAVGALSESDIMLASASNAVVVGFQVVLTTSVRKVAEREQVDVRLYSIIYDAINEVKLALEGMLSPDIKEEITSKVEVRHIFKSSKVGQVAGSYVLSGTITRNDKIRILRNGFEIFKGTLQSLKHIKDDVKEMKQGFECGITISGFNDYEVGDIIESYKQIEVKRKLS
jgi:translation initiation factor IF-2